MTKPFELETSFWSIKHDPEYVWLRTSIDGHELMVQVKRESEGLVVDVYDESAIGLDHEPVDSLCVCVNDLWQPEEP
jgi:hypothetical protein